jgi:hypothetical protein
VVDEEERGDIQALPNLDYKIVQGNSLIGVAKNLFNQKLFEELETLKPLYFDETNPGKKKAFKEKIDHLIDQITNGRKDFDFEVYFSEIFHEKKGFDVVIANPPYIKIQSLQASDPSLVKYVRKHYDSAPAGNIDIYIVFLELALRLLGENGHSVYILPNKFFQAQMGKNIRELIEEKKAVRQIVDFGANQIFGEVTNYTCIFTMSSVPQQKFLFKRFDLNEDVADGLNKIKFTAIPEIELHKEKWHFYTDIPAQILNRLNKIPTKLKDITRKIFVGLQTSADNVYVLHRKNSAIQDAKEEVIKLYSSSLDKVVSIERSLVKPFLMGKDVKRYILPQNNCYVLFPYYLSEGKAILCDIQEIRRKYPLAWDYISKNRKLLEGREHGKMKGNRFYAYVYPKNLHEFESFKIITPDIVNKCEFTIDNSGGLYFTTTVYGLAFNEKAICDRIFYLAILNSRLLWFYVSKTGTILRGGYTRFHRQYLENFPIIQVSSNEQRAFIHLVEKIMAIKNGPGFSDNPALHARVEEYEQEINRLVYELYGLTPEEIAVVEGEK